MDTLHDVAVDEQLIAKTRRRFDYFIPNYLRRFLRDTDSIVSIGCGLGYDVQRLCADGFDAYGFDPGARTRFWSSYPTSVRERLRVGFAEDLPFGRERFDFGYALEVIEHVGCEDGVWKLLPDATEIRRRFFESCLDMIKPGGRLLVSTSNRLCPIDVGHTHHYNGLTDFAGRRLHLNLAVPWDRRNFVWSLGDVAHCVERTRHMGRCRVEGLSTSGYPSKSSDRMLGKLRRPIGDAFLRCANLRPWRTSFVNPILVAMITKDDSPAVESRRAA